MKPKMHHQVQPRQIVPPPNVQVQGHDVQVQEEIDNFLQALDSYPARVAKEPRVSFQQHLSSFFTAARDRRHDNHPRRQ